MKRSGGGPRNRERLSVMKLGNAPVAQLVRREPSAEEGAEARRAAMVERQTGANPTAREQDVGTINVAVDAREQAALFFRLPKAVRDKLTGGLSGPSRSHPRTPRQTGDAPEPVSADEDGDRELTE